MSIWGRWVEEPCRSPLEGGRLSSSMSCCSCGGRQWREGEGASERRGGDCRWGAVHHPSRSWAGGGSFRCVL